MNKTTKKCLYVLVAIFMVAISPMFIESVHAAENNTIENNKVVKTVKQQQKELKKKVAVAEEALEDANGFYAAQSKKLAGYKNELAYYQKKSSSFDKNTNQKKVKEVNAEISKYTSLIYSQEKAVASATEKVKEATANLNNAKAEYQKFEADQEAAKKAKAEALKKAEADHKAAVKKALEENKQELIKKKAERKDKKKNYALTMLENKNDLEIKKAERDEKEKQNTAYILAEKAWLLYTDAKAELEKANQSQNKEEISKAQKKLDECEKELKKKVAEYTKYDKTKIKHDAYKALFEDGANAETLSDIKQVYDEYHTAYQKYDLPGSSNEDKANFEKLEKELEKKIEEYKKYNPTIDFLVYEKTLTGDPQNTYGKLDEAQKNLDQANHNYISHQGKLDYRVLPISQSTNVLNKIEKATSLNFKAAHRQSDLDYFAALEVNGSRLISQFEAIDQFNIGEPNVVNKVIAETKQRAIDAGFYLIGLAYEEETKTIYVDMGHIGDVDVKFGTHVVEQKFVEDKATGTTKFEKEQKFVENKATGTTLFTTEQIKRKFGQGRKANPIQNGEIFNFNTIQDRFYELNAHPDIKRADIRFSPNTNVANRALDITLNVEENDSLLAPAHFIFGIDNFGSMDGSDEWMARGTVQFLNLWQCDHALTVNGNYSLGGSLYGVAGSYYIPRSENGSLFDIAWTLHGGYTDVSTEDVVPAIDVEGKGYFGGLQASKRLIDSRDYSLDLSLGLTYRYVDSALVIDGQKWKMGKNGEGYEIMPLSLALIYTSKSIDSFGGRNYATIEAVHNIGGSSLEEMQHYRATIDDEAYTLVRAQIARIQLLSEIDKMTSGSWMLFAKLDSQFADGPLNGAEQFGLGGHGTVRGYEERQFMADSGVAGTLEIRTPLILGLIDRYPMERMPWDRMQFVGFFDYGWYNLEDGLGEGDDDSEFICSVGLGLRFVGAENAQLRLDWGIPLIKDDEKFDTDSAGRIHLSMQLQF